MEKIKNSKNIKTKKNLLSTTFVNKKPENKNSVLKRVQKNIENKKKIIHKTNRSLIANTLDKEKLMTKQNSNNFTILYISQQHKKNINKIFLPNSCKKRELKTNKTNNIFNKTINIKHKKLSSITIEHKYEYKKFMNRIKTNLKESFNTSRYKPNLTNSNIFNNYNKSNNHLLKLKKTISRNQNSLSNNKLLNRSVELRNKIKKYKLNDNSKTKLIKNKSIDKQKIIKNTEKLNANEFNEKDKNYMEEIKSNTENCQTFSNKENNDTNENNKTIYTHRKENDDDNQLRINTNYEKGLLEDISLIETSTEKKGIETENFIKKIIKNKKVEKTNGKKMKNLINEFCINNSRLNINKNKPVNTKKFKKSKNKII